MEDESQYAQVAFCLAVALAVLLPSSALAASPKTSQAQKEWTILMYWDGDNSLEFTTDFCVGIWEEALTSNSKVNVVAFIDIKSMDGTWIYEILPGDKKLVMTGPEKNTADPAVLRDFVLWGLEKYPAKKTMLVVQDHGFGWRGICKDETGGSFLMTIDGLAGALKAAKTSDGRGVDLLAFDACNMATIEIAYELRGVVPYFVASETTVPFDGLPYRMFIGDIVSNPTISPADLATNIVHEYVQYYSSKWDYEHIYTYQQDFATMSAFDLSKTGAMGQAFVKLAQVLEPLIPQYKKAIEQVRGYALQGQWTNMAGYEWMPDAYAVFDGLKKIPNAGLVVAIDAFETSFNACLLVEDSSARLGWVPHGMNIWFPPSLSQYNSQGWAWARQFVYNDIGLDLVSESAWYDRLMSYYGSK